MRTALHRMLLVLLLVFLGVIAVSAQDDDAEDDLLTRYADIPQERGEDGAFILGDPEAPVTIIEFADFLCSHCQDYELVMAEFIDEYVATGQARVEYRFFPIIDDQISPLMSQINECAAEKEVFWGTHSLLYELARERQVGPDIVEVVAERMALDLEPLEECIPTAEQYAEDFIYGVDLDVTGTPAIRVRVGDGEPGLISIDGQTYGSGGVSLEVLAEFVESEDPQELVSYDFNAPPPEPQIRNENYLADDSLVSGDPCGAPCWREIVPGETDWDDALAIIEGDETLSDLQIQSDGVSDRAGAAWAAVGGDLCCQMFSNEDGSLVDFLILQTTPDLTFEQVIEEHGEPQLLQFELLSETQGLASAFFPDVPMLVYVFVGGEEGAISEESEVIGFAYMPTALMDQLVADPTLTEWDGYGSFADYTGSEDE